MGYIYIIKNDINDKAYVGKTLNSLEKRFKEHCADSKRIRCENRPQYSAMRKYGTEHFFIELLESCADDIIEDREVFWIEKIGSFKNGYNATKGGDGRSFLNLPVEDICSKYISGMSLTAIADEYLCDPGTIRKILVNRGVKIRNPVNEFADRDKFKHPVKQIDKQTKEIVNRFSSVQEAERSFNHNRSGHIGAVCRGIRKSAYGYLWEYDTA